MTENEIRAKVVATAKKYLGRKESDGGHRRFIDAYNGFKPLPRNHRMTYSAAWCATFVSAIAIECGLTEIIPVECGCSLMIGLYKKLGRWREDENYIPKAGDIIFYDWDDGKDFAVTDNTGSPEHVGIVTDVSGGVIAVVEGNKGGAVGVRYVRVNGRYIRGFGLPDYAKLATPEVKPAPKPISKKCPYSEPKALIKMGSRGDGVRWVQWCLNKTGAKLKVDGYFGVLTQAAVLRFQKKQKLAQDGIVGTKTRAALRKAVG
ncbi:MAG: peptidoglycan-binding protein [Ruminococcus sp.]|nr:peptidoglycan-binding protein [Ruminococcus sp.]